MQCRARCAASFLFFFFNDTATTEIYTLSLHDALPISERAQDPRDHHQSHPARHGALLHVGHGEDEPREQHGHRPRADEDARSEEHTSELQSLAYLVCRLLLEKKKTTGGGSLFYQKTTV